MMRRRCLHISILVTRAPRGLRSVTCNLDAPQHGPLLRSLRLLPSSRSTRCVGSIPYSHDVFLHQLTEHCAESKRERERSNASSPDMMLKRLRMGSPHGSPPARQHHRSDGSEASMRGGGPIVVTSLYPRQSDLREPSTHSRSASLAERPISRRTSAFQLFDNSAQSARRPSTPRRSASRLDGSDSPATPPAWMKPLQLVDGDQAIYFNSHGDDWKDHALCLHCFRLHGSFYRVLSSGCEICGRDELLKGHYWEQPNHYHE
jgi:hypothetical protein